MKLTPPGLLIADTNGTATRTWTLFAQQAAALLTGMSGSGVTADRPTKGLWVGRPYFDTTLGKPVWYKGAVWVDATGTTV